MSDRTILVTGSGGFIGGRMVEVLHTLGAGNVRAGLRRWSSGARVGRFPVELVKCDVRNAQEVRAAVEGVTHVVHCAVGDHETVVEGTSNLLRAAHAAGVQRVVHLSTIDVYGKHAIGDIDESHPLVRTGEAYGDSKVDAEHVCQEMARSGLHVTIVRPTLVHGPFSAWWTIAYAQRLQTRPWLIPESDAQGICNLVYVDDVVGAAIAALDARTESGEAFNINGVERPTWDEYFQALNAAMGLPALERESPSRARMSARAVQPLRKGAKLALRHFEPVIMGSYKRSELVRRLMKRAEALIRTTPAPTEFAVYSRRASYPVAKAERLLGWQPRFRMETALPLIAEWLRQNGFVATAAESGVTS